MLLHRARALPCGGAQRKWIVPQCTRGHTSAQRASGAEAEDNPESDINLGVTSKYPNSSHNVPCLAVFLDISGTITVYFVNLFPKGFGEEGAMNELATWPVEGKRKGNILEYILYSRISTYPFIYSSMCPWNDAAPLQIPVALEPRPRSRRQWYAFSRMIYSVKTSILGDYKMNCLRVLGGVLGAKPRC